VFDLSDRLGYCDRKQFVVDRRVQPRRIESDLLPWQHFQVFDLDDQPLLEVVAERCSFIPAGAYNGMQRCSAGSCVPFPGTGNLPGDTAVERQIFRFYRPLATCVLLSLILSSIMWLVRYLSR
jgi:hypothetical protein